MGRRDKEKEAYTDFSNVETMHNFLTVEDLPEGAYGSPRGIDEPVSNKSEPWEEGQRYYSAFNYEAKAFHEDLPRQFPGAHPTHDDPDVDLEHPYTDNKVN